MGRTSAFIRGFEKAAAGNPFKLLMPSAAGSFSAASKAAPAFSAVPKTTAGFSVGKKVVSPPIPKNTLNYSAANTRMTTPKSTGNPVGSYGVPTRATTSTPIQNVTPTIVSSGKKPRFTRSKKVDVVKVNSAPTSAGKGGPAAVTTAPTTPPAAAPTAAPAAPATQGPSFMERIRSSITSPKNKAMTYAGMGVVGIGAAGYGLHRAAENVLGPSRPANDW